MRANALKGEAERCIEHGMDDYLSKPLRLHELDAMLAKWLPLPEGMAKAEAAVTGRGSKSVSHESDTAKLSVWDETMLTQMVGDNPAMQHTLLDEFMMNAQEQVTAIFSAITAGDTATVGRVAHTLKSAARTVGAMQLGELCKEMEMAGKAGDGKACRVLAERLNEIFEAAAREIKKLDLNKGKI